MHPQRYVSPTSFIYTLCFILMHDPTATILSKIVQSIYSIGGTSSRHAESIHIEGLLDKWYFDLPEHLRFEMRYDSMGNLSTASSGWTPSPHILTMHMKYWCTTLLLHRPLCVFRRYLLF